jgi:hypothetical protein
MRKKVTTVTLPRDCNRVLKSPFKQNQSAAGKRVLSKTKKGIIDLNRKGCAVAGGSTGSRTLRLFLENPYYNRE